ncbi:MAG: hypothetical protein PHP85_08945 [Gallionella sp.]|nr:hypothetical protein [Gallionella sp.]
MTAPAKISPATLVHLARLGMARIVACELGRDYADVAHACLQHWMPNKHDYLHA